MIVRCTKKALDLLGVRPAPEAPALDGLEWYANLLWIERRKNLLIVEAETLFAIFVADVRKADVTPFESFVAQRINAALLDERLPPQTFGSLDPARITIARTASRSVLGSMNEMKHYIDGSVIQAGGLGYCDEAEISRELRRMLHRWPDTIEPIEEARARAASHASLN